MGPPRSNLSRKKFLSTGVRALGLGEPLGDGEVPTAGAVVVLVVPVAGDIVVVVVAGVIPGTVAVTIGFVAGAVAAGTAGVMAGAFVGGMAGEAAVVGGAALVGGAGALVAGEVAGGGWPNEVSARVTETKLAVSSVFIGLIREFVRRRIPMS